MSRGAPEREDPWPRMEDAVRETVAALPDFPGFESRAFAELAGTDPDTVQYELSYTFTLDDSETAKVRRDYVAALKRHLPAIGYTVHSERFGEDGEPRALEAVRPDGINVWYRVLGLVSVKAQTGPMPRDPDYDPYCPPPIGGVARDRDAALDFCERGYTDEGPEAEPTTGTDYAI
ncbi:hypothetical protein [Glycomyces tenuis]|uniref:hypothetical protein n=1 Tax=Glycomyces tenuis TaxID=58116 RepID=UPI000B321F09|nr:hypothetical protein [Glycomyces tenuis]